MEELIEFVVEPKRKGGSASGAVLASIVVHTALVVLLLRAYRPVAPTDKPVPIARYIELIRKNPQEFVEAPGPKRDQAPLNALWSDANRRASIPKPTATEPTKRPGDGHTIYTPPMESSRAAAQSPAQTAATTASSNARDQRAADASPADTAAASSRMPALRTAQASALPSGPVNWRSAIKEVGKVATLGGAESLDLSRIGGEGGEKGFAEQGPLSFETQWYDWGEYAQSMVSKIRVHWYENMPPLIRTGMKGVVTIRFTIKRDGRITDITLLDSSGVPPYDFAARKAIELSSPLNPLPRDFPNPYERVTAMFFYNSEPPAR